MKRNLRASITESSQSSLTRAVDERGDWSTIDMKPIASFGPQVSMTLSPSTISITPDCTTYMQLPASPLLNTTAPDLKARLVPTLCANRRISMALSIDADCPFDDPGMSLCSIRATDSIFRVPRRPGERDRVAHIGEAGDVGDGALEAQPEAGVRHRAVAAQIAVPAVVLLVDAALRHARVQHLEPLLALAAADDLADARRKHVHGGDRPAVVIEPHVEGLDVLRVVHDDDRLLCVFLREIALMLGLQVHAP